ncbi:hypothetical protein TIFTF001_012170 [Ficus carica]|uniref:Uncharacterized protein n=1 Tax=Ficus carica TaxID=3494 RepID=A0AA87ZT13_FICCA|nr:hypothetical protein TIFTF001_012170 [Ficus carica]
MITSPSLPRRGRINTPSTGLMLSSTLCFSEEDEGRLDKFVEAATRQVNGKRAAAKES